VLAKVTKLLKFNKSSGSLL